MSKFKKTGVAIALSLAAAGTSAQSPESFVTQEFRASKALEAIRAQFAYAAGYTGKGVVIAIVDSGLDIHHPEFAGRVSPYMYNYMPGFDPTDAYSGLDVGDEYHGTHVAGLAAAARDGKGMHGVAYNAIVLPLRTDFDDDQLEAAFDRAIQAGAKVLNGSYGPNPIWEVDEDDPVDPDRPVLDFQAIQGDVSDDYQRLRRAADADVLMVFAAGNSREEQPGGYTSLPMGNGMLPLVTPSNTALGLGDYIYRFFDDVPESGPMVYLDEPGADQDLWDEVRDYDFSDLRGSLIVVVATDPDGTIASYSNLCGAAAEWCMAAPGGSYWDPVWSTVPYGSYNEAQGTSMASPVVAGAAAVMREAFPYMSARQVIEIVLTSADNQSNAWHDEDTYGRGMLDLGTAINGPVVFGDPAFDRVFSVNTQGYDSRWSNDITGDGGLRKAGKGTLTMSGNSDYTGSTRIVGGKLVVDGSIEHSRYLHIGQDAALGGVGTVGKVGVRGRIAPGNSVGTLTVKGDYTQHSGSVFELELDADGRSDLVKVQGTADIKSGSQLEVIGLRASHIGGEFSFLEADNWVGQEFSMAGLDRAFIDLHTHMSAGAMALDVQRNATAFASLASSSNQRAVANAVESQGLGGAAYNDIVMLDDGRNASALYDALTGEIYASTTSALLDASALLRHAALTRARQAGSLSSFQQGGGQPTQSTQDNSGAIWGQALGSWGHLGATADAYRLDRTTHGLMFGADAKLTDSARAGLALGYTDSTFKGDTQGRVRADGYHFMAYADQRWHDWSLRGGLAHSWYRLDTRRSLDFANWGTASSRGRAQASQVFAELAYGIEMGGVDLAPYAGVAYTHLRQQGFAEDNSPVGLQSSRVNYGLTVTTLGLRGRLALDQGKYGALQATAGLGWRHAMGNVQPSRDLQFATGQSYQVNGVAVAKNAMMADVGIEWASSARSRVSLNYSGQIAGRTQDHGLQASVRWVF